MQVVVQGLLTHYEQAGSKGPRLLLLHGWGDRLETYHQLTGLLQKDHQITSIDLPGFGATEPPKATWGLSDYASFVASFLEKLSWQPDVIVGHSNGGSIAVVGLANGTLTAKQLVLLASAGVRNRQKGRKLAWKIAAKTGKAATAVLPRSQQERVRRRFYGAIGSDLLVAPHLQETFKRTVAEDITPFAKKLSISTLLVYGDEDEATPVETVGTVLHDAIPDSCLEIIHQADHFVHQQASADVARLIREFVS
ncbi:alpha/beta hydrolase [Patescibacteria group bacterium]|nr:MAG: alpha/beta hydrolase [Patescibacteria group bacterium]